jgi:hypothetical protein
LCFWFFAVSDGFFTGDASFFIGPADFFWTSTGFSDNVAIFFTTSALLVCLSSHVGCTCNKLQDLKPTISKDHSNHMPLAGEVALYVVVVPPVAHLMRVPSQETSQSSSSSPQMPWYLISSSQGTLLSLTVSFVMLPAGQDLSDVLVILQCYFSSST